MLVVLWCQGSSFGALRSSFSEFRIWGSGVGAGLKSGLRFGVNIGGCSKQGFEAGAWTSAEAMTSGSAG